MLWRRKGRPARRREFRPTVSGLEDRQLLTAVPRGYASREIGQGLVKPTSLAIANGGRVFVAQQEGQVRVVQGGRLLPNPALSLRVDSDGERGLVGLALDPNFPRSPWLYVYYTVPAGPGMPAHNRVSKFLIAGNTAVPSSEVVLLDLPALDTIIHNGGSLSFGKDGTLFVGVGDNYRDGLAQSLSNPFGKILRIRTDGSIPQDNPYYGVTSGINRAIWAYGLRNPFTTAVNPRTGVLYVNDVGLDTWEEVNIGTRGANLGWPRTEGPTLTPGVQGPLYAYRHDGEVSAIAGGAFDSPNRPLTARDTYYFSDLTGKFVRRLDARGRVSTFVTGLPLFPTDVEMDRAGRLYVLGRDIGANPGLITVVSRAPRR